MKLSVEKASSFHNFLGRKCEKIDRGVERRDNFKEAPETNKISPEGVEEKGACEE